jgi:hypothetical protein
MKWMCSKSHTWSAEFRSIKTNGTWCPECSRGKSEKIVKEIFENMF